MRSPNTQSNQVQQKHTAPYFVSHLDSMSSNKLTSHLHSFPVSFTFRNLCKSSSRPCFPVPYFFLSDLICYLSLCTSAIQLMCEPCNVLQSGPRFDFLQPFFPFGTYASRLVAPAFQFPMDLCSASAIQPISFLLVVSQNSFNSIKLQISNPKFPLLLFTLSNTPTQNYTTVLPSLRILCKARLLQILLNSMPAFW